MVIAGADRKEAEIKLFEEIVYDFYFDNEK